MVRNGLRNLKEEIKKMDEEEKETKKPNKIASLVKMILEFKNQNQERKGLKMLTSDQMIKKLPISLAKVKAKNNSEKLKKKKKTIRQLQYSLCCSRKLTKAIQNNLINTLLKWKQFL